ncbi:B12-binding domain-containing radical SAM protein [Magnetococcus sp. PR-3]|uniref:B12-binding domain-containing radical SAM protein n=1 Tax=Magnetococcus sp. PR-3 TaxID=3120355 RepID=UPI002FCE4C79
MRIALVKMQDTAKQSLLTAAQYPVNLAYLASTCQERGHEVELWDFVVEPMERELVEERIRRFQPQVIGVSCVTSAMNFGKLFARWVKEIDENIYTILGGVHITVLPIETLNEAPEFDLGVVTEGEETLPEILDILEKGHAPIGIAGTVYRENGKPMLTGCRDFPDVNKIPYPNRDLLPSELYLNKHSVRGLSRKTWNIIEVDSSRGCPFRCTFCNVEVTHGRKVRYRTPQHVLGEVEACVKKYGTNCVVFNDSTFTFKKSRVKELVLGLPKVGIEGYHVNGHVKTVDAAMLQTLAETGCQKISFGVESGSQRVLDKILKNATLEEIREAFTMAKRSGIPIVEGTFILGSDIEETEEDFASTGQLMRELRPDIVGMGIITPFPGTAQYTEMKSAGYLEGVPWDDYQIFAETPPPWRLKNFSAQELVEHRNRMLKAYYWNLPYIFNQLTKIRSVSDVLYYMGMMRSFYKVVVRNA